jgi:hypothetical protein
MGLAIAWWLLMTSCQPDGNGSNVASATTVEKNVNLSSKFEIHYSVSGGEPFVDASLHIDPSGQAEMYLGSSWSLPPGEPERVGFFNGSISADDYTKLASILAQENIFTQPGAETTASPGAAVRFLSVTREGKQHKISMAGKAPNPALAELEKHLLDISAGLVDKPERAIQAALEVTGSGTELQAKVTFTNVGHRSMHVLLYDPSVKGQLMAATLAFEEAVILSPDLTAWQPHAIANIPAEYLSSLFEAGDLQTGILQLAAGERIQFALPEVTQPAGDKALYLSGTFTFWLPGEGSQRRRVTVQTTRLPLKGDAP